MREIDDALLRAWPLPGLDRAAGKEARGRVLVVAGCRVLPGAPVLCADAALRSGAGRVLVATGASIAGGVGLAVPESRLLPLAENADGSLASDGAAAVCDMLAGSAALLAGPGLLDEAGTSALLAPALRHAHAPPILLDAAAMRAATVDPSSRPTVLLTPHAGELAHLGGQDKAAIEADPLRAAKDAACRWNAVVALKGQVTVIAAPDGQAWRHDGGDVGLGTAGSGDVLAGLAAGLLARGAALEQAAVWAVALHGLAGRRLAGRVGRLGYLAREIAGEVPALMQALGPGPAAPR